MSDDDPRFLRLNLASSMGLRVRSGIWVLVLLHRLGQRFVTGWASAIWRRIRDTIKDVDDGSRHRPLV